MKHNFVIGVSGGLVGSVLVLIVLSAAGIVGARNADVRSDVSRANDVSAVTPLTSTFTYQGQLKTSSGSPISAMCDFQFGLWNSAGGPAQIGITQTVSSQVSNGLFTVGLNFGANGNVFNGSGRWLQIAVRCPPASGYTPLNPRQPLTAAPYAFALPGLYTQPNATSPNIIGGYSGNFISSTVVASVIGGGGVSGSENRVQANYATVGGGASNTASNDSATVSGGWANTASGGNATVGGGWANKASGTYATVGGGDNNTVNGYEATVGGGAGNTITGTYATVGGGWDNSIPITGSYAFIGGGASNIASGENATVGGGWANTVSGSYATVGGGNHNTVNGYEATVGGGNHNTVSSTLATDGGGASNIASGAGAFVGGGGYDGSTSAGNQATGNASTVGGGLANTASGTVSGVGGYATVGGGYQNTASGDRSTISGGLGNTASGLFATVPGGYNNVASGQSSFAAGQYANTNSQYGAFVWSDASTTTYISATVPNEFLVRASGGITLYTDAAATIGAVLPAGSSSWGVVSDRNAKANFAAVDDRAVLDRLASIPVQTWNYKTQDVSIRHIGPMAQDFYAAFQVGENNTTISTVDAQGVALAAIQGLYQQNQELKAQIEALQNQAVPPASFNPFNLLSVIALIGFAWMFVHQRKQPGGRS